MATVKTILERKGREVATIGPEATVLQAAQAMNERKIGSLVVVVGAHIAGIVTERDILSRIVASELDPATTRVDAIMTKKVASCTPDTPIEQCGLTMIERRIRRLPVVVDDRLIGIVTAGDVMRQENEQQREMIGHLTEYMEMPPVPPGESA
jgi:CBS domain-containing protein